MVFVRRRASPRPAGQPPRSHQSRLALASSCSAGTLDRRTNPTEYERTLGPAFDISNYIFYRDNRGVIDDDGDAEAILRYMISDMSKGSVHLRKDRCIFYTKGLNSLDSLIDFATTFTCQTPNHALYTIWVRSTPFRF
jgi:hypothetical protein